MKALVLKKHSYGESDSIVEFLLESGQVIRSFAKFARRSKKRFPHQFNVSGVYEIDFARQLQDGQLLPLSKCELVSYVSALDADIDLLSRWCSVLEWVRLNESERHSFEAIEKVLFSFQSLKDQTNEFYLYFVNELLSHGLHPQLESCLVCQTNPKELDSFSLSQGGAVHRKCEPKSVPLGEKTRSWLHLSLKGQRVESLENEVADELDQILLPFLQYQLGRPLKSYDFFMKTTQGRRPAEPSLFV